MSRADLHSNFISGIKLSSCPYLLVFFILAVTLISCHSADDEPVQIEETQIPDVEAVHPTVYVLNNDIPMKDFFNTVSAVVDSFNNQLGYDISEYTLIHANKWILDSLISTDYYTKVAQGIFIDDFSTINILHGGDTLIIPDYSYNIQIQDFLSSIQLDVNIPEYVINIKDHDTILYRIPIRVGRASRKYLAMAGKVVDLRTKTGKGQIVRIEKNPTYINPANNRIYKVTTRDDGKVTSLPLIPWIEPELDGIRHGQWIHPTTNINTLGKAYSNGCIGVSEGNMWLIYFHSPVGTPIEIRYDLNINDDNGQPLTLPNIYPTFSRATIHQLNTVMTSSSFEKPLCTCF